MMRISTLQFYKRNINLFDGNQNEILKQQIHISTGKRIQSPADAPTDSVRIAVLEERMSITEAYNQNIESAEFAMEYHESNLSLIESSITRLIELQVRGSTATNTDQAREAIALEAQEIFEQLFDISNSLDVNGNYLYAGSLSQVEPFVLNNDSVSYAGDRTVRETNVTSSMDVPITYSGFDMFMDIELTSGGFTSSTGFDASTSADPEWAFRETVAAIAGFPASPHVNTGTKTIDSVEVVDSDLYLNYIDDYFFQFDTVSSPGDTLYTIYDSDGQVVQASQNFDFGEPISFNGMEVNFSELGTFANDDVFRITPTRRESIFDTVQRMVTNLQGSRLTEGEREAAHVEDQLLLDQLDHALSHFVEQRAMLGSQMANVDLAKQGNENIILTSRETIGILEDADLAEAITILNAETVFLQAAHQTFAQVQQLSLFNFL